MRLESFINIGLLKSDLKRFWPLWVVYLAVLGLLVVAPLYGADWGTSGLADPLERAAQLEAVLTNVRAEGVLISLVAAAIVAVSLNEHLFGGVAATFYGSAPLRRRALFASRFVAGLIVLAVVPAVAALCLVPLCASGSGIVLPSLASWCASMLASSFVFYAVAQCACQLSGTRSTAVLLYGIANILVVCMETAIRLVLSILFYGMSSFGLEFYWLSPAVAMERWLALSGFGGAEAVNWQPVLAYCVAAAVLCIAAGALHGKRAMERAGDPIVFASLRPVLKYLAGASNVLLFAAVFCLLFANASTNGLPVGAMRAAALAASMAVGAFLGVMFAEMIMARSSRVLGRCWKGALVLACVAVAFVGACRFDAFGIGSRVPAPDEVESVTISLGHNGETTLASEQAVRQVGDLHRDVLAYGRGLPDAEELRSDEGIGEICIEYLLKNGSTVVRCYPVLVDELFWLAGDGEYEDDETDAHAVDGGEGEGAQFAEAVARSEGRALAERLMRIANSPEGRESRLAAVFGDGLDALNFGIALDYGDDGLTSRIIAASDKEDFYETALKPDVLEGAADVQAGHNATIAFESDPRIFVANENGGYEMEIWLDEQRTPRIVKWVRAHYPTVSLKPLSEDQPRG